MKFFVDTADSDTGPHDMGSFASRGTHRMGNAIIVAAREARGVLLEAAAELFADKAERIVALDKNLEMLRVARAKLQHLPTAQIELVQGDFADLPFPDSSFDTVVLHQVLHFAADPAPALAEAARVLRSGGRIAIVDFASHDHEELRTRHQHVRLGFTDRQMADLLRGAGFSVSPPLALEGGPLVVKIWTAKRRPAPALKTPASLTETV